jgi:hypothetical protein
MQVSTTDKMNLWLHVQLLILCYCTIICQPKEHKYLKKNEVCVFKVGYFLDMARI